MSASAPPATSSRRPPPGSRRARHRTSARTMAIAGSSARPRAWMRTPAAPSAPRPSTTGTRGPSRSAARASANAAVVTAVSAISGLMTPDRKGPSAARRPADRLHEAPAAAEHLAHDQPREADDQRQQRQVAQPHEQEPRRERPAAANGVGDRLVRVVQRRVLGERVGSGAIVARRVARGAAVGVLLGLRPRGPGRVVAGERGEVAQNSRARASVETWRGPLGVPVSPPCGPSPVSARCWTYAACPISSGPSSGAVTTAQATDRTVAASSSATSGRGTRRTAVPAVASRRRSAASRGRPGAVSSAPAMQQSPSPARSPWTGRG